MIQDIDKFEDLPPEQAKYVLAETKLKLMNLMSHLEFLESRLAGPEKPITEKLGRSRLIIHQGTQTTSTTNSAQQ
jgi:hypothetical protein